MYDFGEFYAAAGSKFKRKNIVHLIMKLKV